MMYVYVRRAAKRALPLGLVSVLAACGGVRVHAGTTPVGVLRGHVTAGPTCPVERIDHPCPPRRVVATVRARIGARVIASTQSTVDGSYRLELPSGSYTLSAATGALLPRCLSNNVDVVAGTTTELDITCDTGIR